MNPNTKWIVVAILVIIVVTTGCVKSTTTIEDRQASEDTTQHTHMVWYENNIKKITIPEDNVTCYTHRAAYAVGISCVRDEVSP
jgi:hypothetical protein